LRLASVNVSMEPHIPPPPAPVAPVPPSTSGIILLHFLSSTVIHCYLFFYVIFVFQTCFPTGFVMPPPRPGKNLEISFRFYSAKECRFSDGKTT
jgi:hypothetical protein